jgi:hypothetical protein
MAPSGMLRHVALVRTDVSEKFSASIIRVTRIGELGTTLAITSNRRLQEPYGVTSHMTPLFYDVIIINMKEILYPMTVQFTGT